MFRHVRYLSLISLAIIAATQLVGLFGPQTCRLSQDHQANLSVRQADGTYQYVHIINARSDGKWAVLVSQMKEDDTVNQFYRQPLTDFSKPTVVAWNVTLKLGLLSKWDHRVFVEVKDGHCQTYTLSALYPD